MKSINWAKRIMLVTFILIVFRGMYFGYQPHMTTGLESLLNLLIEGGYILTVFLYVSPMMKYMEYKIEEWEKSKKKD